MHVRKRTLRTQGTLPYQTVDGDAHRAVLQGRAVNLIFSYVHPSRPAKSLGPYGSIRLSFDGMRGDADDPLLAAYHKHQWDVDGLDYFRLDCTDRVVIHFERAKERSSQYGPYERFSAVNALAYGDDH